MTAQQLLLVKDSTNEMISKDFLTDDEVSLWYIDNDNRNSELFLGEKDVFYKL